MLLTIYKIMVIEAFSILFVKLILCLFIRFYLTALSVPGTQYLITRHIPGSDYSVSSCVVCQAVLTVPHGPPEGVME